MIPAEVHHVDLTRQTYSEDLTLSTPTPTPHSVSFSPPISLKTGTLSPHMCRSKRATSAAKPSSTSARHSPPSTHRPSSTATNHQSPAFNSSGPSTSNSSNFYNNNSDHSSSSSAISSRASLASIRQSLPENPILYHLSELRSATNNFLSPRHSPTASTPSWRCSLRGKDALLFQRKLLRPTSPAALRDMLSSIGRSHHVTIINLLGSAISGTSIFLAYEFAPGTNLADCLRNPNNPSFTPLSTWMSRIKIATDLANSLDYIHNSTGLNTNLVHNHIKSTSIIVSDPSFSARICHFGTSILRGEPVEHSEEESEVKFQGKTGYMSPEFQESGVGSQRSDVYALGVVILELVSGQEAVKYKYDKERKEYVRTWVVEGAREAVGEEGRMRRWVDGRLRDSFPVEVAERVTRLALECVQVEEYKRPDMRRVAGKVSKLYLESKSWADRMQRPVDLTVSFGPR